MAVYTTANLKAFLVTGFAAGEAVKFVAAVSPVMWAVDNSAAEVHMIVDGHAFDADRIDAIAESFAAGAIATTEIDKTTAHTLTLVITGGEVGLPANPS